MSEDGRVRVLAKNLLQGGGARIGRIPEAIGRHRPDVVCLAEYRSASGATLVHDLARRGYEVFHSTDPPPRKNGVALFSRFELRRRPAPEGELFSSRWLRVDVLAPAGGFGLLAVHVPPKITVGVEGKVRFWDALLAAAQGWLERPFLIVGDLNTGAPYVDEPGATLYCAEKFIELGPQGWVDLWRRAHGPEAREWSWTPGGGRGAGYRLDHAYASPPLAARVTDCRYSHRERYQGISDPSILLVDVAPYPGHTPPRRAG